MVLLLQLGEGSWRELENFWQDPVALDELDVDRVMGVEPVEDDEEEPTVIKDSVDSIPPAALGLHSELWQFTDSLRYSSLLLRGKEDMVRMSHWKTPRMVSSVTCMLNVKDLSPVRCSRVRGSGWVAILCTIMPRKVNL